LSAGTYTIVINGQGVSDFAPTPQHVFTVTGGGDPCADLELVSIQWHPFSDTAVVVHVQNNSASGIFGYPNFILFNANGDTLAKEIVSLFGIAEDSWHVLRIQDGVDMPASPFDGTLELWTGFTTELACAWELQVDLCPPQPACVTLYPTLQNFGGMEVVGTFTWTILDDNGQIASGEFELDAMAQADSDTLCLAPGNYHIDVTPQQPPFPGGQLIYSVVGEGYIPGPSLPVSWNLPVLLPFPFVPACISGTNGIAAASIGEWSMQLLGSHLQINSIGGKMLGPVRIFDAEGRLLTTDAGRSDRVTIPLHDLAPGVLLVHASGTASRIVYLP
jgi:hypothetical protein